MALTPVSSVLRNGSPAGTRVAVGFMPQDCCNTAEAPRQIAVREPFFVGSLIFPEYLALLLGK